MALINHRSREIHFKIVYVGPGLGGKTTNLQMLHDRLPPERRGRMVSISTDHERTLFFDFLPIDLGQVNGFLTRFHLYTVPGQAYYRLSRRAVLQGLDGEVFIADSHPPRDQANLHSIVDTRAHLSSIGLDGTQVARMPWVFQYNKRDVVSALPVERLRRALNPAGAPEFEAVAREGRGVSETLRSACKGVLARLTSEMVAARPASAVPGVLPLVPASDRHAGSRSSPGGPSQPPTSLPPRVAATPFGPSSFGTAVARPNLPAPRIATAPRRSPRDITRA